MIEPKYTEIADSELDTVVSDILSRYPNSGIITMKGFLLA